jgi:choline dehydrogenase-like flavoprotein
MVLERWLGHSERSLLRSRPPALGNLHQVEATDPVLLASACARQEIHTVAGVAHQAGTCWVGSDPATSVLDPDCGAHEPDNLCVVATSFFPSIGAVKPVLTAIANALHVGDRLLERMRAQWPRPEPAHAA